MALFLISDTHFGHAKACQFLDAQGNKTRPWDTVEAMDEAMVEAWNATVCAQDTVYHLGDVVIPRKSLQILSRLNGRKILIRGNHDIYKLADYAQHFEDIRGAHVREGKYLFSHIPCHRDSVMRYAANIHGHLHSGLVLDASGNPDPLYHCVCVEHTGFAPIAWEAIRERIDAARGT